MWLAAQVLVVPLVLVERTFSKSVARISVLRAPGPPMIAPATHDTDRTTTSGSEKMIIKDDGKVGVGTLRRVMSCWPSPLCLSLSVSLCLSFSLSPSFETGIRIEEGVFIPPDWEERLFAQDIIDGEYTQR